MDNHQSECNFLSTVSIFSSPPLAARCPLSPLLPAAAALSFCLPLPSPSTLLPLSLASAVLSFPLSRLRCPLLPLSLASAALSFPSLSPPLSSPSPLSRLCCPLLPLSLASAVLSFPFLSPPLSSHSPLSRLCCPLLPLSRLRCPLLPLSRLRCRVRRVTTRRPPLSASLCLSLPFPPLYFSLHFLPFLPPPLSFLPPFNDFLHFFVAVLPFSSAVCAFSATNVEFSHPPLRDKLVASPIPLHFPSLSPRSLHLPLSASLRPPPLKLPPQKKSQKKLPKNLQEQKKPRTFAPRLTKTSGQEGRKVPRKDG